METGEPFQRQSLGGPSTDVSSIDASLRDNRPGRRRGGALSSSLFALAVLFAGIVGVGTSSAQPPEEWPGNTQGLAFLWQDAAAPNEILDARDNVEQICRVRARGRAKFGRFDTMDTAGGWFETDELGRSIAGACTTANAFTLEASVKPATTPGAAAPIIVAASSSASSAADAADFALRQEKDRFTIELRAAPQPIRCELGAAKVGQAVHLMVMFGEGRLTAYIDGKPTAVVEASGAKLAGWSADELRFGGGPGEEQWAGFLEGIAVYSRTLPAEEVAEHFRLHQARVADRQPAERIIVEARLTEVTRVPPPAEIAPYPRALAVYTYAVERVLEGDCPDKEIQVAHWVIMDRQPLPNDRRPGQQRQLTLEKFEDHLELDSERLLSDSGNYDLPLYYDVSL